MRYLVDTHVLLWSFFEPERLSEPIQAILLEEETEIYYSPVSLWEISIKYGLKKLSLHGLTPEDFFAALDTSYYICTEIRPLDAISAYRLPPHHKDPFNRFLIWEAIRNDFTLLSVDRAADAYTKEGLKIVR
ncbi:MAG: type II toxin-antitoxin system VapC family toxin [Oscillospiraceae bacterium]|jgi:PIN domain nuclease of toxin-antitoxin system|nr:type II toxin-antitoxin system VapC family toxin [Oscillospiraceae bacterium]